jgi:hypothetical protein
MDESTMSNTALADEECSRGTPSKFFGLPKLNIPESSARFSTLEGTSSIFASFPSDSRTMSRNPSYSNRPPSFQRPQRLPCMYLLTRLLKPLPFLL